MIGLFLEFVGFTQTVRMDSFNVEPSARTAVAELPNNGRVIAARVGLDPPSWANSLPPACYS